MIENAKVALKSPTTPNNSIFEQLRANYCYFLVIIIGTI